MAAFNILWDHKINRCRPMRRAQKWREIMPLLYVAIGVALLLLLMIRFKLNGFIALILVALAVGVMQGMPVNKVIMSIKAGVGGTLGSLALIMGFGAMLGKLLADCGGAQRIATTLIAKFGEKHIQWALVLTGFTVGFALFYEVGFVLMLPLVFSVAASARVPLLYVGVPMAAALSVTHGFLPPHPGPTAIATLFNADMGKTLLYGTLLGIPTVILAGPVYARFLKGIDKPIPEGLWNPKTFTEAEMPSFGVSVWTALVPMALRAIAEMLLPKGHVLLPYAEFFGDPIMATLIAVLIAIFTFGLNRGRSMDDVMGTITDSIKLIAMMLLIIGGGGAFKQVLVDSGVDKYIASMMHATNLSPIFMAWSIAAVLRIALGSATVAAITAGGIVAPLIVTSGASPELMVIAVGSGSVIFSHVNDPGFWLFKEYFNLTIGETIRSWSALETIISVCGLIGCLLLANVI